MKILHIITKSELGGAQSVLISIVNALCTEHEVAVIAGEGDGKIFDAIDNNVQKVHYPCLQRAISAYYDMRTLFFLWKFNRTFKPDIIHLHSSKAGLLGRLILPKRKVVYTVHGFDSIRVAYRKLLPIERLMQKQCTAIVGVSQYDMNNLHSEGISTNTHLVYNGVELPKTKTLVPFNIPTTYSKIVLCIARVAKPKRHDIFIECAKLLPTYAFVWIGNLDDIPNVPQNVFFMGNIPHAAGYCRQADLFMLPSDYEGLPIVILEAMSYGKPIVASKVGGIPEIVINGKNGYVLPNNANMFAEKIDYILQHCDTYQQFSNFSYNLYIKYFTVNKMVDSYMEIYKAVT